MEYTGWIKLHRKILGDSKFKHMSPTKRSVFIIYLLLAKRAGKWRGYLVDEDGLPLTQSARAECCGIDRSGLSRHDKELVKLGVLEAHPNGRLKVKNYDKYQGGECAKTHTEDNQFLGECAEQRAIDRAKTHNRHEGECAIDRAKTHTSSTKSIPLRREVKKIRNIDIGDTLGSRWSECLEILKTIANYPCNPVIDNQLLDNIETDFPAINVLEQLKAWRVYKLDKPLDKKSNSRNQFRNWCKIASERKSERQYDGRDTRHTARPRTLSGDAYDAQIRAFALEFDAKE